MSEALPPSPGLEVESNEMDQVDAGSQGPFAASEAVTPFAEQHFVIGGLGSLNETMGPDEADKFLNEHSLTRISRLRAARRLGRLVFEP